MSKIAAILNRNKEAIIIVAVFIIFVSALYFYGCCGNTRTSIIANKIQDKITTLEKNSVEEGQPGYEKYLKDYKEAVNDYNSAVNAPSDTEIKALETKYGIKPNTGTGDKADPAAPAGSCPYLYVWNGNSYIHDNDIIPFKSKVIEGIDYYRLQQPVKPDGDYYKFRIAEELPETSFLDSMQLITVDHPANVDIYPDINGKIYSISNPRPPLSCIDNNGNDCSSKLAGRTDYAPGSYFDGKAGDYIIVDLGNLSNAKTIKLVMGTDSGCSIRLETAIQTQKGNKEWSTHFHFSTHEFWAINVFDISGFLPDANGEYKLRIYFTDTHKINYIAIDTTPEVEKVVTVLAPIYAKSAYTDTLNALSEIDSNYIIMNQGDELIVKFPYRQDSIDPNYKRNFILVSKGYFLRK